MKKITELARAKINLTLDVLGTRPDGYHQVEMIMQSLEIHDLITVSHPHPGENSNGISLTGEGEGVPWDESNLAYRAAAALFQRAGYRGGVDIHINKVIPVAAGLAGGSADAAATLKALNQWGEFGYSLEQLMEIGATLGSDIPFCLLQGTALAQGRGEKLTPLPPLPSFWVVLAKPPVGVSTAEVYKGFSLARVINKPDTKGLIKALEKGQREVIPGYINNVLETVTIPWHPVIEKIKQKMLRAGALGALMSGSGPTVYALTDTEERAIDVAKAARGLVDQVLVTKTT